MRANLRKAGFEVVLASGGEDGLHQFRQDGPMSSCSTSTCPTSTATRSAPCLRDEAGDLLPIVMVTGMDDPQSVERAYHAGVQPTSSPNPSTGRWWATGVRYLLRS